jgi:hypothetical protein
MLMAWVDEGILRRDESGDKRRTLYRKPNPDNELGVDLSLSLPLGALEVIIFCRV